jgi:hypothetical protein
MVFFLSHDFHHKPNVFKVLVFPTLLPIAKAGGQPLVGCH